MEEIKMTDHIIPVKSNDDSKTSNANESNIKNGLQNGLQKIKFTTNNRGAQPVNTISDQPKK